MTPLDARMFVLTILASSTWKPASDAVRCNSSPNCGLTFRGFFAFGAFTRPVTTWCRMRSLSRPASPSNAARSSPGSLSNARSVGAKIVSGPLPRSKSANPAAPIAALNACRRGVEAHLSRRDSAYGEPSSAPLPAGDALTGACPLGVVERLLAFDRWLPVSLPLGFIGTPVDRVKCWLVEQPAGDSGGQQHGVDRVNGAVRGWNAGLHEPGVADVIRPVGPRERERRAFERRCGRGDGSGGRPHGARDHMTAHHPS